MLGSTGEHASLHFSALLANASFDARCCEDETPFKMTHQNGQQVQKGGAPDAQDAQDAQRHTAMHSANLRAADVGFGRVSCV